MLALKYGQQLDEADFMSKAEVRCDQAARLSPGRLAEALNSEPALRLKDVGHQRLLQLQICARQIRTFEELRSTVRRWPGTASAIVAVASSAARAPVLVAGYRESYADPNVLVGRARGGTGRAGPLHTISPEGFRGAVILEPVIVRVLKYEAEPSRMLDLQIPSVSAEYGGAAAQRPSPEEATLASRTCGVLADLAPVPVDPRAESAALSGCSLAADLMGSHAADAGVQAAACRAVGSLMPACARTLPPARSQEVIEMMTAAMRRHSHSLAVQEAGCTGLAGIVTNRSELQSIVSTNGGVEQVVSAMNEFPDSATLQTWACGALASLSANHPMNQSAIGACRGVEGIAAAMRRHMESAVLVTMACGALGNLAAKHFNNQSAIAAGGGVELTISAMRRHPEVGALQQSACGALWCLLSKHPENQAATARAGGPALVVAAVQRHPDDPQLRALATGVLQVLIPGLGNELRSRPVSRASSVASGESAASRAVPE